jgi:hypothetical protein
MKLGGAVKICGDFGQSENCWKELLEARGSIVLGVSTWRQQVLQQTEKQTRGVDARKDGEWGN